MVLIVFCVQCKLVVVKLLHCARIEVKCCALGKKMERAQKNSVRESLRTEEGKKVQYSNKDHLFMYTESYTPIASRVPILVPFQF